MLALVLWTAAGAPAMAAASGPLAAAAADGKAEGKAPCPGCPDEEDSAPCPPTCTACACRPFARSLPAPTIRVEAPVLALLAPARVLVADELTAPSDPTRAAVFHPPRR